MLIKQFWIIPYKIASGIDDVWMSYAGESEKGWIMDGVSKNPVFGFFGPAWGGI